MRVHATFIPPLRTGALLFHGGLCYFSENYVYSPLSPFSSSDVVGEETLRHAKTSLVAATESVEQAHELYANSDEVGFFFFFSLFFLRAALRSPPGSVN